MAGTAPRPEDSGGEPQRGRRRSADVWIGIAIGLSLHIPAVLYVLRAPVLMDAGDLGRSLLPALAAGLLGIAMLLIRRTRRIGAAVLIATAAVWIVFLGPCIGLLFMLDTFG